FGTVDLLAAKVARTRKRGKALVGASPLMWALPH
ncbi:MAG: hypothetical protein ACI814_003338, partial [Mariniblastus sp.]